MMNDILQACIFLGASLTVNGIPQGEVLFMSGGPADHQLLRVDVWAWHEVTEWDCGVNSGGRYVDLTASLIEGMPGNPGDTVNWLRLWTTDPTPPG